MPESAKFVKYIIPQISIDTLMLTRSAQDAALRADLADLRGARLVTTSEVEKDTS
jgi:predicted transcriptional regulator